MIKNMTRKGLAIGATAALTLAGLVGFAAPAQAAGEVVFAPTAGTSTTTFVTESFSLSASMAPGQVAANIAQLRYQIEKPAAVVLNSTTQTGTATADTTVESAADSTKYVVTPASPSTTAANKIAVQVKDATATTDSVDVVVTAFIDSNNNGVLDAGEFFTARTVSFKKYSEVSSTIDLTQPIQGDANAKATMSFVGVNHEQLTASDVTVSFNSATAVVASNGVFTSANFANALTANQEVSVQAKFKTVNVGTAAVKTATASTIASIAGSVVEGANAKVIGGANHVRLNSAFAVKAVAKDSATPAAPVAGVALTAAVTTSVTNLSGVAGSVKSITVNGVTYTDHTKLPTALALTTDANGEVFVNISSVGLDADDTITVQFAGQNVSNPAVATVQKATALTVTNDNGAFAKTTQGGTVALSYSVKDQFGENATGALRLAITSTGTNFVVPAQFVSVVAGKASVSVTAAPATVAGTLTVASALQSQGTDANWSATTGATNAASVAVNVTNTADAFDVNPTTAATSGAIARVDANGNLTNKVVFTGSVNNAGAQVVVSGLGLKFGYNGNVTEGSVTVTSGANGDFSVDVFSHKPGTDVELTFTTGADVKTAKLTWAAAEARSGKSLTIAVTNARPGATMTVTGTLVDEYGNPVKTDVAPTAALTVVYAGPGLVVGSIPTATDAAGKFTFNVLLGSNDNIVGTVTATYGGADGLIGGVNADDDITTVYNLAAVSAEGARGWTRFLSATNELKIYARDVVGAGKVQFMVNGRELAWIRAVDATDPKLNVMNDGMVRSVFVRDMLVGRNVVEIYVDGVRLDRRIFTR